ncbi:uncharacterized protein LOC128770082 [Synchiropus splendidus]|uniref:uncharacterized protein LOC128770082 n=1 Tax=Synchiropus splendidus TaxID=270530 RepID=UPI00237DDFC7|nr:uncharacterized protein LOC128770082 [Synchiropus splendidus]
MENNWVKNSPEIRINVIGQRWAGKSSSCNTIVRKDRFECGRVRTTQCEVRHEVVEGRKLTVVDTPGWNSCSSLAEIPEGEKLRFKLIASKCPPGPHATLLTVPIDTAFTADQRKVVEQHVNLLGERVWRFTILLFTFGDMLGETTIEQHIESEGDALKWLVEKCHRRYHVFNNKDRSNSSQVKTLLEKIERLVEKNNDGYYELDGTTFHIIHEKQQEVVRRAKIRQRRVQDQRQQMKAIVQGREPLTEVQMVLLGSRNVGKTSIGNLFSKIKMHDAGMRTASSVALHSSVGNTKVTLVDTPGWWKSFPACDTAEATKDEVMRSVFLCPPGPHVFLLVIDSDSSFNAKHLEAITTHMELFGDSVWRYTVLVFTRGDWLGSRSIEEFIEGEGEALWSLVDRCENRYHVIDGKNGDDGLQVAELMEQVTGTVAGNNGEHFVPDEQVFESIVERGKRVVEAAALRRNQVDITRKSLRGSKKEIKDLRVLIFGERTAGKSSTANTILQNEVFRKSETERCQVERAQVADRWVTVMDTPGLVKSCFTEDTDKEIARGLTLCPEGFHAVLVVVPCDLTFQASQLAVLKEYMNLFDGAIWKHTIVLFTYIDKLADKSFEEHIEREHHSLRVLVDMCENRYHGINNMRKSDHAQVSELYEKIDEMVASNLGQVFCPDMADVDLKIKEKLRKQKIKLVLDQSVLKVYQRRELEMKMGFRDLLLEIQDDIKEKHKPKLMVVEKAKIKSKGHIQWQKNEKEKKEDVHTKINREVEKLNKEILKTRDQLRASMDIIMPNMSGDDPPPPTEESLFRRKSSNANFDNVLYWLSTLQLETNYEDQLTLNFSSTSGYQSIASPEVSTRLFTP